MCWLPNYAVVVVAVQHVSSNPPSSPSHSLPSSSLPPPSWQLDGTEVFNLVLKVCETTRSQHTSSAVAVVCFSVTLIKYI